MIWKDELEKIAVCPQRQDSTKEQLQDLILVANRLGFYDAADYLLTVVDLQGVIGSQARRK